MTKLQKRIENDHKEILKMVNAMYKRKTFEIGAILRDAFDTVVKSIAAHLLIHENLNYSTLVSSGVLKRIEQDAEAILGNAAYKLENIAEDFRYSMNLTGRLASSYIARKATPPWIPIKLDIGSTDGSTGPGKGLFIYYMKQLSQEIVTQVSRAALNEESAHGVLKRVRTLFNRASTSRMTEANKDDMTDLETARQYNYAYDQQSITAGIEDQMFGKNAVSIKEGFYTIEDIEKLQIEQRESMRWSHRQYRPWFSDELKSNNRVLRQLETNFMSDMIEALHSGMLQIGSENLGIKDFEWVISRPQPKCDECTKRDGLTMKEIKSQIKDQFKDQPPPLHPNCRCQLVPKIKDDWAKSALAEEGLEWDSDEGVAFNPTDKQKELGFKKMNWDDWLSTVQGAAQ